MKWYRWLLLVVVLSVILSLHTSPAYATFPPSVEKWRPIVTERLKWWHAYYHQRFVYNDVSVALYIMLRESGGNRFAVNPSSGAAGLYQWLPMWWRARGYPVFDGRWNIGYMAKYHAYNQSLHRNPWGAWLWYH